MMIDMPPSVDIDVPVSLTVLSAQPVKAAISLKRLSVPSFAQPGAIYPTEMVFALLNEPASTPIEPMTGGGGQPIRQFNAVSIAS